MIQISNLQKKFGEKTAVNIDNYLINQGDMLGLVGNNGAGKTTLFRLILDLLQADRGKVTINDIDVCKSEDWKNFTGAFIDDGFLIDYLTPEEYFYFIGKMYGLKKEEVDGRIAPFERFMNGEVMGQKKFIRNFSAGNKQKIGIISAMLHHPQLLILDEPFNFLDPSSQSIIKQLLKKYNEEHKATVIISSHNLNHTVDVCPRIALLEHGSVIYRTKTIQPKKNWKLISMSVSKKTSKLKLILKKKHLQRNKYETLLFLYNCLDRVNILFKFLPYRRSPSRL